MTLGELRQMLAHLPDETEIGYANMNFRGEADETFDSHSITLPHDKWYPDQEKILVRSILWEPVD